MNNVINNSSTIRMDRQLNLGFVGHQHYHPNHLGLGVSVGGGNPVQLAVGNHLISQRNLIGQPPERSTRSPIGSHPMSAIGSSGMHHQSSNALSPNFHPALSPLATKSPSVSPLAVPAPPPMQQKDLSKSTI
jgi:hypothetical protein